MNITKDNKFRLKSILTDRYVTLRQASLEMGIDYQKLVKTISGYYKDEESKKIIARIEQIGNNR